MCEVCNNRFNNSPACCDDGEPDNLEQPTGMNYMQANDILSNYIARNPPEIVISNFENGKTDITRKTMSNLLTALYGLKSNQNV